MVTRADLLQAVLDDPADDGVRLVFCDYLEEHGEEVWAEFIRVQIELEVQKDPARRPAASLDNDHRQDQLERRQRELLDAHGRDWAAQSFGGRWGFGRGGANQFDAHEPGSPRILFAGSFRRGFVDELACNCATWMEHAGAVMAAHPVTRVRLTDRETYYNGGRYAWFSCEPRVPNAIVPASANLPAELFDLLSFGKLWGVRWRAFREKQDAVDALSAAALVYGQQQSKLARDLRRARP